MQTYGIFDAPAKRGHNVNDGKVWCEGCRAWLPTIVTFEKHKAVCPGKDTLVEVRRHDR
jgi:hypothetical protein